MIHIRHILQRGNTALHDAAANGHLEIATLLISGGCDINAINKVPYIVCMIFDSYTSYITARKYCTS